MMMEHAFGLDIPRTLDEVCDPRRLALLVYDMQIGVVSQLPDGAEITRRVAAVLQAARGAGIRTFFTRHMWLPKEVAGVAQLRTALAWQRVDRVADMDLALAARGQAGLDTVAGEVRTRGRRCVAVATDVGVPAAVDHLVGQTLAELGRVDVLGNNAGVGVHGTVEELAIDDW